MISSFTKASLRSFVICFLSSDKIIIQSSSDNQLVNGGFDDITAKDLLLPLQQVDGVAQGRSQVLASISTVKDPRRSLGVRSSRVEGYGTWNLRRSYDYVAYIQRPICHQLTHPATCSAGTASLTSIYKTS